MPSVQDGQSKDARVVPKAKIRGKQDATPNSELVVRLGVTRQSGSDQLLVFSGLINKVTANFLVDSGANTNCVSTKFVQENGIVCTELHTPVSEIGYEGQSAKITKELRAARVWLRDFKDKMDLMVLDIADYDMILEKPWLSRCQPKIDWRTNQITLRQGNKKVVLEPYKAA